jgi:hypothetical protein
MIEVERSGGRLRLRACRSGENSTAVDWHALPKTSAEIELRFVRRLKSVTTTRYQVRCGRWRRVVSTARRCAFIKTRDNLGPNFGPKLFGT